MINKASQEAYNFAPGFYVDAVNMVFELGISTTNRPNETFNLLDLARHDEIEADGSLTRNDVFFGDDVHFDAAVFAPVAKDLGLDKYHRADSYVTVETAAKATKNRLELAKSVNPAFNASAHQHATEYGTTALYLLTVWDEQAQASPKSWVRALLGKMPFLSTQVRLRIVSDQLPAEDRIPYKEGYSKGKSLKTMEQIGNLTQTVREVAGWKP